jgi:ADP-heptose:LPS heptosyltransferase
VGIDALRLLDRILGLPLCWLFTMVRRLARKALPSIGLPAPRRVLIIKLSEMGSTVLAYPALEELNRRIPGVELFFLVFKNNAAIVDVLGLVPSANIITVDYGSLSRLVVSGFKATKRLLSEHIDTTIDMDFFSRLTALISFLVCRGNRIGFHRYNDEGLYRGDLLTHRVAYSSHVHTSAAFMALARTVFAAAYDEPHYRERVAYEALSVPRYDPAPEDAASVKSKLAASGRALNSDEILILINPNSSDIFPLRKWPLEYFARLCEQILRQIPQSWLVITGVATEHQDAEFIRSRLRSPRCIDFTGKTSFRELLALYGIARLMITNDSGPAHFASLLSLPTIVLFGPETPRLYSPLGPKHRDIYANFACSPCVSVYNGKKSPCTDNRCLKAISTDEVLQAALALLGHSAADMARARSS